MTKDKTVTMSRELAESLLTEATNQNWSDLNQVLNAPTACRECMGTGGIGRLETCEYCKGTGKIAAPVVERQYKQYTTQPAESLAGMAARQLKDEGRWIEIRDANALEFPDMAPHDYYPVGSVIRIPCTSPPAPVAVVFPSNKEVSLLVWSEVLKAETIPGVSCFNAAEFAVEAVISLIKELNP
ncbi:hypothetical protein JQF37_01730 [Pseudomonas sp. MIL9]|uniref:hypothetical protein n=1 Tax=Pseudomonas sp. MIL9 TaxID=2807620 RepID=UPI0019506A31|nr:hypothetical protein [Pseudomonas sp. MIL9]MBM6442348.1 hypothetical protein [Pseudomonas sp. MIL9]